MLFFAFSRALAASDWSLARIAWPNSARVARQSSDLGFRKLAEELSKKAKEIWKTSYKAYQLAEKSGTQLSRKDLHRRLGCVLLAMEEWEEAFKEFEAFARATDGIEQGWMESVVSAALSHITSPESYDRTKAWLEGQRERCQQAKDQPGSNSAQAAMLLLVREKYWTAGQDDNAQAELVRSPDKRLLVNPVVIEADTKLFPIDENWDKTHPLFLQYLPDMRERIKRETGVGVPRILFRGNEADVRPNSYVISINEVPLVLVTVEPELRFYPTYSEANFILEGRGDQLKRAFNPLTGDEDGAWIEKRNWADFQTSTAPLWDKFEYIIYHLEQVLRAHLSSFLGMQEVHELLEGWLEKSGDDEAQRWELTKEALRDSRARVRFMQVLQGLVKEAAPITNLSIILESFRQQSARNKEVIPLIEAARGAIKNELPGNDGLFELFYLSPAFEEEVNRWLCNLDGKVFFAIPPEETQALLAAFRSAVEGHKQSRLTVVTRLERNRPFVRRLIEIEFPRVTVLSAAELRPGLRDKMSGTVEYLPIEKTKS